MKKAKALAGTATVIIAAVLASSSALAQSTDAPPEDASSDDIVVTGTIAESLKRSMDKKRSSPVVVEAISISDLNQLPDVSVADALSRLPGLTALRDPNNGAKSTISLRGMGPALSLGTLNGRDLATPNPERSIRYDQFPSELIGGVIVYKSPMASIVEGGVSGSIDLQTVRPLDWKRNTLAMSLLGSYNVSGDKFAADKEFGERASISYIGRFLNNTLGIAAGYAGRSEPYNELRTQHASFRPVPASYGDVNADGFIDDVTYGMYHSLRTGNDERHGGFAVVEWQPSDKIHLNVDGMISRVRLKGDIYGVNVANMSETWGCCAIREPWRANDYQNVVVIGGGPTASDHGQMVAGTITGLSPDYGINVQPYAGIVGRNDNLWSLGGNLIWSPTDRLDVVTDAAYSHVTYTSDYWELQSEPLTATGSGYSRMTGQSVTFDGRRNPPVWSTNVNLTDPNVIRPYSLTLPYLQAGRDQIFTYRNDVTYELGSGLLSNLRLGGRYVYRNKTNTSGIAVDANGMALGSIPVNNRPVLSGNDLLPYALGSYDGRQAGAAPRFLTFNFREVADKYFGGLNVGQNQTSRLRAWDITEKVWSGYGQIDFGLQNSLSGNVGVRVIKTDVTSSSIRVVGATSSTAGVEQPYTARNDYTDILPSLNLTWRATQELQFRLGLAKTIARPPIEDMNAGFSTYEFSAYGGNPFLQPFRANQADVSAEYYFGKDDYVSVTGFVKDLKTYITTSSQPFRFEGIDYLFYQPVNGKGGRISGFEATLQKSFDELPAPFDGLGVYGNYAFVNSNILVSRNYTSTILPLSGLARNSGTAMVYYSKSGFATHIAYNYRDALSRVVDGGGFETDDAASYLDAQASYEFVKGLTMVVQAQNILNTPYQSYVDGNPSIRGRYAEYGRIFYFGIRANF